MVEDLGKPARLCPKWTLRKMRGTQLTKAELLFEGEYRGLNNYNRVLGPLYYNFNKGPPKQYWYLFRPVY